MTEKDKTPKGNAATVTQADKVLDLKGSEQHHPLKGEDGKPKNADKDDE